jgi:hypothetical protein
MISTGCVQPQEELESAEPRKATVKIDFEDADVDFNCGMTTIWTFKNGNWNYSTHSNTDETIWIFENVFSNNISVYGFLIDAAKIGDFEVKSKEHTYGILVESIGGVENGIESHYWQYWLNDEYGSVASDKQEVHDNDFIEWKYCGNPYR